MSSLRVDDTAPDRDGRVPSFAFGSPVGPPLPQQHRGDAAAYVRPSVGHIKTPPPYGSVSETEPDQQQPAAAPVPSTATIGSMPQPGPYSTTGTTVHPGTQSPSYTADATHTRDQLGRSPRWVCKASSLRMWRMCCTHGWAALLAIGSGA